MSDSFDKEKKKNKLLFWIPFILVFVISVLLFIYFKNTIIGWGLLIVFFVIIFLFKKFLSKLGLITIIGWIVILVVISAIFSFTLQGNIDNSTSTVAKSSTLSDDSTSTGAKSSNSSNNSNSTSTESKSDVFNNLQFSNNYDFPNNKGTYVISVTTDVKKNEYILTITVKMPKEAIPEGFKWDTNLITDTITVGTTKIIADDHVAVYWQSLNSKPDNDNTYFLSTDVNAGKFSTDPSSLVGFKDATFTKNAKSLKELKNYMQSGDKLDIYWYNVKEAGAQVNSNSIRILYEKGYGLHPNIAETTIPWSDIITKLGI